ncbi:MAG: FAD-dependent oxidoreductase [Desulfobacterales bacterium]|jgi:dihydrolipoamide dehydrogenase|nr:FAD-dependent oxidoreductase [Desulfobacterales bacterium]
MSESFDLIVIGGGPGGVAAAVRGVQLGVKTAIVESTHWGGFCLNRACVPTKLFAATLERSKTIQAAAKMGFSKAEAVVDPAAVFKMKDELVAYFSMGTEGLVKAKGVTPLKGKGRLAGPGRVAVGDKLYQAKAVIVAVGAQWVRPSFPGAELEGVVNSSQLIEEGQVPGRALILGAGPWAMEMAQFLGACGSQVVVAARERGILPEFDAEIGQRLRAALKKDPLEILSACQVVSVSKDPAGLSAVFSVKGKQETRRFDRVIAFDRRPDLAELGLETVGLEDLGVDERLSTNAPGVWAVGDVIGKEPFLSHRATAMGILAAENALGAKRAFNPAGVPRIAYTCPQAASVGLTEDQAEEAGYEVVTGTAAIAASPMAMIQGAGSGVVKVVGEKRYGELLGVHILAPFATEIIGAAALAIQMEATLEDLARAVLPHPTIAESLSDAAREALGWAIYIP